MFIFFVEIRTALSGREIQYVFVREFIRFFFAVVKVYSNRERIQWYIRVSGDFFARALWRLSPLG